MADRPSLFECSACHAGVVWVLGCSRLRLILGAMSGANGETEFSQADKNVEMWRIKKLIKSLEAARGWVTSFIIFYLIATEQV